MAAGPPVRGLQLQCEHNLLYALLALQQVLLAILRLRLPVGHVEADVEAVLGAVPGYGMGGSARTPTLFPLALPVQWSNNCCSPWKGPGRAGLFTLWPS